MTAACVRGLSISAAVLCDCVLTVSCICALGSLIRRVAASATKRTTIGITLARACTRACCNSQRAVSAPTASAVAPAREVAAEQMLCASGRHKPSDLQSTPHCPRVKNQGRTTLWDRQGFCKVAQILSQELSSFSEPEIMDLWFTLLKGAVSN